MSITEKQIKAYEEREKKELYDEISKLISDQTEIIELVKPVGRYLGFDINIPNIGITFNNKIIEVAQEFKEAGISMYAEVNQEYNYIDSNMVGDAIIIDIAYRVGTALKEFEKYQEKSGELSDRKADEIIAFTNAGPIKKFFYKAKYLFASHNEIIQKILTAPKEVKEINSHLAKFRELEDKLFQYNLKENVNESIVRYIKQFGGNKELIPSLIEKSFRPTLEKLGLGDLIPEIKKEFQLEEMKEPVEDKKSWEMSNWGIDVEYVREEAAKVSKDSAKTKEDKFTKELSEIE